MNKGNSPSDALELKIAVVKNAISPGSTPDPSGPVGYAYNECVHCKSLSYQDPVEHKEDCPVLALLKDPVFCFDAIIHLTGLLQTVERTFQENRSRHQNRVEELERDVALYKEKATRRLPSREKVKEAYDALETCIIDMESTEEDT